MAHVFLSSFESEVSIRGLTDQAGNATFPGISPSPLHVFLAHPDVLAKWSFPDGFGVSNRVVSLPIGDTFPHEVFTVADSVTHDPISMAHIEWSGQSIESFSSDSLGLLRFPPRTKNIDLIELSADGYGKQLVPLDDGGPTLYLQPEVDLTVQVVESQGLRQATGATVAAFLRTPNGMVHLSTKEADSKGHCRFSFHDGDDVALLAWRSHSGMATHELIVSRPMSEVRILLLKQKPLLIHLNGETAIGDLQVTTDSIGVTPKNRATRKETNLSNYRLIPCVNPATPKNKSSASSAKLRPASRSMTYSANTALPVALFTAGALNTAAYKSAI